MAALPRPFGRYILEKRIAMGGMAEIFRGRTSQEGFSKTVCIKRVLPSFLKEEDFVRMFRDEAALVARLQHANVVQVFDFGEAIDEGEEDPSLFLAMELVDGCDLKQLISLARKRGDPIPVATAVQIAIEVCRGLHHAHSLEIDGRPQCLVHRDVSPHNILVSRHGEVKVTDFGIAKAAERATHTGTGIVKGKIAYMAPEQLEGAEIDHRVDQFAAGIVFWEMLTGRRLFDGDNEATILRQVMMCQVPTLTSINSDIPADLEKVILKALSASPDDRHTDMRAFERELTRFLYQFTNDPADTDVRALVDELLATAPVRKTAVVKSQPKPGAAVEPPSKLDATPATGQDVFASPESFAPNLPVATATDNQQTVADNDTTNDGSSTLAPSAISAPVAVAPPAIAASFVPGTDSAAQPNAIAAAALPVPPAKKRPPLAAMFGAGSVGLIGALGVGLYFAGAFNVTPAPVVDGVDKVAAEAEPAIDDGAGAVKVPPPEKAPEDSAPETVVAATPQVAPKPKPKPKPVPKPGGRRSRVKAPTGFGLLQITVKGSWAYVYENGKRLGETPLQKKFSAGKHTLVLKNPETGKSKTVQVTIKKDGRHRKTIPSL